MITSSTKVTGDKELDRKLATLANKTAKRAMGAGIKAELTVLGVALKAAVNASDAPPAVKREARKTIHERFLKGGTNRLGRTTQRVAKVGFGVGKQTKAKKRAVETKAAKREAKVKAGKKKGVGISSANVHWFVLGTNERRTSTRATGRIQPVLKGLGSFAASSAAQAAVTAAREAIWKEIQKDALKKG